MSTVPSSSTASPPLTLTLTLTRTRARTRTRALSLTRYSNTFDIGASSLQERTVEGFDQVEASAMAAALTATGAALLGARADPSAPPPAPPTAAPGPAGPPRASAVPGTFTVERLLAERRRRGKVALPRP